MNQESINYKIFDVHTHAFPDKIAKKAVETLAAGANIPYYHNGSFGGLMEYEQNGGAAGCLLLPIATKPSQTRAVNEWAAKITGNGIYSFGSVHPDQDNIDEELNCIVNLGLRGVKLHPEYQEFFADEERMIPIYKNIFDKNLILCFHAGVDIGFPPPVRGAVNRIAKICDMFPHGKIIAAHMGGFKQWDDVRIYLAGRKNVWFDTSYAAQKMNPSELVDLIRLHGSKKVMFGTDTPWTDFESSKNAILNSGLSQTELKDIFYDNAARLLQF